MANLKAIAELAHRAIYPETREKPAVTLGEFIATAKIEYATAMWIYRQEMIRLEGGFDMPTNLLEEATLTVENNVADISKLEFLSGLPGDLWIQDIGGSDCNCKYIPSTSNLDKLLCAEGGGGVRRYRVQGKKIIFPDGAHTKEIPIVYAGKGANLNEDTIEVSEYIGSMVRDKLHKIYSDKQPVDMTNNQSANT